MTKHPKLDGEVEKYFDSLTVPQAHRFNLLVTVGLRLGKPIEGAYSYAMTVMKSDQPIKEGEK